MARKLTKGIDELMQTAIRRGLEQANPHMVKVAKELMDAEDATEILKSLEIEITPYEIPDTSIRNIVLKAPDYVIAEIVAALKERKTLEERIAEDRESQDTSDV